MLAVAGATVESFAGFAAPTGAASGSASFAPSEGLGYADATMVSPGNASERYRAPRGTTDILPADEPWWTYVRRVAEDVCHRFGYRRIETPMFEDVRVFLKGAGEGTDIVEREMYVFEDRGGDRLALRPEGTANVLRAYLEHGMQNLPQPVRLFYISPVFRYDRPQAGRYRQHHQVGAEAIGEGDAMIDAEVIDLLSSLYRELGLSGLVLKVNSIGEPDCRSGYLQELRAYYAEKLGVVCADCRDRYQKNPLRLLDCKQPSCQPVIAGAPTVLDSLCSPCRAHWEATLSYLETLGIGYEVDPRLVRGLDYYTRTVFEFQPQEEGAQSTVGGGGRYDGLMELLGGPRIPGIGFGTGIERIIRNLRRLGVEPPPVDPPDVYLAHLGERARGVALQVAHDLRRAGIGTVLAPAGRSLKAQLRQANSLAARFAAILGDAELEAGEVMLRDMRSSEQRRVSLGRLAEAVRSC